MKFLIDAHLPRRLVDLFHTRGHDALHTSKLPLGNDTEDDEIVRISLTENRVVVSKDGDFFEAFTAKREPYKLLHITTGNIDNATLLDLFEKNFDAIIRELDNNFVVELNLHYLITIQ